MTNIKLPAKATLSLWKNSESITKKIEGSLSAIHGIGFTEYMVLYYLSLAPQNTMRRVDIADALGRTASSITKMLSPMEKIGLVKKKQKPRDARVSLVELTTSGERIYKEASLTYEQKSNELMSGLSASELKKLMELLNTLGNP